MKQKIELDPMQYNLNNGMINQDELTNPLALLMV